MAATVANEKNNLHVALVPKGLLATYWSFSSPYSFSHQIFIAHYVLGGVLGAEVSVVKTTDMVPILLDSLSPIHLL